MTDLDTDSSCSSESDIEMEELMLLYCVSKTRVKSVWQSKYMKKRKSHGEFVMTKELDNATFSNYTRCTRDQFEYIHSMIEGDIFKEGCNFLEPIGTREKLTIFLRFLASGDSYKSLAYSYRMNDRSVSNIINEVSDCIWKRMKPLYMPEPTEELWRKVEKDFSSKWNFPHCIGSIDGKHVTILKPIGSNSSYFNYKGHFSIVLLATVDAHYRFTMIDVGSMGRFSDSNVFWNCEIGKRVRDDTLNIPPPSALITTNEIQSEIVNTWDNMPYIFVGDEAFPLMTNLMRPFPKRGILHHYDAKVFNYRLSRARQTVECAFGILASRFRVFRKPFEIKVETVDKVVKASCVLHNYLRGETIRKGVETDIDMEGMPANKLISLQSSRVRATSQAFKVRDNFKCFFTSPFGEVSWQEDCVNRGKY